MIRIVIFIALMMCFGGCSTPQYNYSYIPNIMETAIEKPPSFTDDMFLNINTNIYKKGFNYFVQVYGKDTLNILQYDNKGRLIYKMYRQYMHQYLDEPYLTMIEINVYNDTLLEKTYYLHSNIGIKIFENEYSNNLISKMTISELGFKGKVNQNSFGFIKRIYNYNRAKDFIRRNNVDEKAKVNYQIKRQFKKQFITDSYKLNDGWLDNTNYYYNKRGNLDSIVQGSFKIIYDSNNNQTMKIGERYFLNDSSYAKIIYHSDTIILSRYDHSNDFCYWTTKEFENNTIYMKSVRDQDTANYDEYNYHLDSLGVPDEVIIKNHYLDDSIVRLRNYYFKVTKK